jgi:chromosome segregation protein
VVWEKLQGDLRDARSTAQRLEEERGHLATEWERTVTGEQESRIQAADIEQELVHLAARVQDLHVSRDERMAVLEEREREKTEASALEQQDAETVREVRRRALKARQESHELELKLHDLEGNLLHLEERLRDEYEIDPAVLDGIEERELPEDAPQVLADLKERIRRLGPVNLLAMEEYEEKSARLEFMTTQRDDLLKAKDSLMRTIEEINKTASGMFLETFSQVQENFRKTFQVLFQGGECSLTLTGDDPLEADIEVTARPRGKRPQGIQQLSSGERALTAIALLFAIYLVKPSPFCILDEVDAPLDDANVDRFVAMVREFSKRTQFIVITHNKKTMEAADCLYGITMQRAGISSVVSVKLDGNRNGNGNGHPKGESAPREEEPLSPESAIAQ